MEVNLLRLAGFGAIREGLQTVMHDTTVLLAMAMQQPDSTLAKTLKLLCGWVRMGWRISGSEVNPDRGDLTPLCRLSSPVGLYAQASGKSLCE